MSGCDGPPTRPVREGPTMIRILLAVNDSPAGLAAARTAIRLAQSQAARSAPSRALRAGRCPARRRARP